MGASRQIFCFEGGLDQRNIALYQRLEQNKTKRITKLRSNIYLAITSSHSPVENARVLLKLQAVTTSTSFSYLIRYLCRTNLFGSKPVGLSLV